jgi:hypothetical protein
VKHPDGYEGDGAADRVAAFLDAWALGRSNDPDVVYSLGRRSVIYELTVTDLRELIKLATDRQENRP